MNHSCLKNLRILRWLGRGAHALLAFALAFWLVPTGRAQNLITANQGFTPIYSGPGFSTSQNFIISLPSNLASLTISVENLGTTTGAYSIQFVGMGQQATIFSSAPSVFCTHQVSGALPPTAISNLFATANAPSGQADTYSCPIHGYIKLGLTVSTTANGIGSFLIGVFTNQSPPQFAGVTNGPYLFTHIATATNTQVKALPGTVHTITINGGTAGLVTVVDTSAANCTGGTTIAIIETIGATNPVTLTYDVATTNGICVTTAAATDITVSSR